MTPVAATAPPLVVLLLDDEIVAVDKPPGLPTTIGRTAGPSLAGALEARFPEMRSHAGLVHRLDTGTSGVLLAARNDTTYARLRTAFVRKRVQKDYLAVVLGRLVEVRQVSLPLARHRRSRGRMVPARSTERAWPAVTEVIPVVGDAELTVVRLRMRTGVTHQLRVHLASLDHPILGDRRYGTRELDAGAVGVPLPTWHFLHAHAIAFDDAELPQRIATPFPAHWRPLFAARRWSIPTD